MRFLVFAAGALLLSYSLAGPAMAAWPHSPYTNLPICTAPYMQSHVGILPDGGAAPGGASGVFVFWDDGRTDVTHQDIYVQHVLASGVLDAAWPVNGRALCSAMGDQGLPVGIPDGAGGAILAWQDERGTAGDIYAQHMLPSGLPDPAWPVDGRALCTATGDQFLPVIVSDGAGGAIVAWWDRRGGANFDLYAQHVLASGAVDPAWPANGRAICTAAADQQYPTIATDGAGGAIVVWHDARNGALDIYAQHVLATGAVDTAWPANGLAICYAPNIQQYPKIVPDGAGGAIITWQDQRAGVNSADIYAQHVLARGECDVQWPENGLVVCAAASSQQSPDIATDGAGGAIVAWNDYRSGTNHDIYAQHLLPPGTVDPAWPVDGRALCTTTLTQWSPKLVPDGAGGTFVTWYDYDIAAQHVLASGAVDPAWPANGRILCAATDSQEDPVIATDGSGGFVVAWVDYRSDPIYHDIYAQRVGRHGYLGTPEPELVAVADVPDDEGGRVKLSWNASWLDLASDAELDYYDVLRSVPPSFAAQAAALGTRVRSLAGEVAPPEPGDLVAIPVNATTDYWEYLVALPARHYVAGYSYVAATHGDSVSGESLPSAFLIMGRNSTTTMWWPSAPVSGFSVDNLAPAAPAPFTGQYAAGTATLHWNPNAEPDLSGYRLYRGTSAGFTPGPENLVAALPDTGYRDEAGAPRWYKLAAVDVHGNESPVTTLLPVGVLGVEGGTVPAALAFAPPAPNPAAGPTMLRYALPRAAHVRLAIYDAAGRLVRELANGARDAGEHTPSWDLRDGAGDAVRAGLYFARLEVDGRALVRRVAVLW